ncbi:MAG TPA: GlsB/YeaQ/YmgE family stress response membrane protein [Rubrobacteraceae bacterium]|nr:GlsB/YeaQ/YmgE family stress response membrane protein [Rubrobacteraceae bacterium]
MVWIVVGLIAGILAKWVMPGPDPGGVVLTALIGIVGAIIGGWVLGWLGFGGSAGSLSLESILTATLGAIILLAIYRLLTRRTV